MIKIKSVANGAVADDGEQSQAYIFGAEDLDGLRDMLFDIKDTFYTGSRYDRERIQVSIVHGDKYECKDAKCEVCTNGFKD